MNRSGVRILRAGAAFAVVIASAAAANAQGFDRQGRDRVYVARVQGVPPGQLPPANGCRVWYDHRPPGRQPSPTTCHRAEAVAARDRNARVVYGENAWWAQRTNVRPGRDGRWYGDRADDRAIHRDGAVRDPRLAARPPRVRPGRDVTTLAYRNGYRDGLTKGREDAQRRQRYDAARHGWYRSATRGYDRNEGTRAWYQSRYREAFEDGYADGYRIYAPR